MALENVRKSGLLKEELDLLRPLNREQEARIMQKFRLDWNYHSNHLEGNSLTYGETKALILHGITAQGKPLKDHFEITGHDEAIKWIYEVIKEERPLTESFVRELHTLLLKESSEKKAITADGRPTTKRISVGKYKTEPNQVKTATGETFYFATPEETPAKMHDLFNWYNEQKDVAGFNPILLAAEFHYKFIRIHPFDDGNGRTARIIMNFILMRAGYPPVIIKTEDKENYYSVLRQADADILEPFLEYIASNLNRSLEIMISGAKGENIDEENDIDKELFLLEQRLNTIGEQISVFKSTEALHEVFDTSMMPLYNALKDSGEKFSKFYWVSGIYFIVQDVNCITPIDAKLQIKDSTNAILITQGYHKFNRDGIKEFDYLTTIKFLFEDRKFLIKDDQNNILHSKLYDQHLTAAEIKTIVNKCLKDHLLYIKLITEEAEKRNNS